MEPPLQRPASWYPEYATADRIAWRGCPACEAWGNAVPTRSQISEARHSQPGNLYIGRGWRDGRYGKPSRWGNPFRVSQEGRKAALAKCRDYILTSPLRAQLPELAGKTLLCSCRPNQRCHGDVLVELFEQNWAPRASHPST